MTPEGREKYHLRTVLSRRNRQAEFNKRLRQERAAEAQEKGPARMKLTGPRTGDEGTSAAPPGGLEGEDDAEHHGHD